MASSSEIFVSESVLKLPMDQPAKPAIRRPDSRRRVWLWEELREVPAAGVQECGGVCRWQGPARLAELRALRAERSERGVAERLSAGGCVQALLRAGGRAGPQRLLPASGAVCGAQVQLDVHLRRELQRGPEDPGPRLKSCLLAMHNGDWGRSFVATGNRRYSSYDKAVSRVCGTCVAVPGSVMPARPLQRQAGMAA